MIGAFVLPETDTYFITAANLSQTRAGAYSLMLQRTDLISIEANSHTEVEINGDTHFFSYTGQMGEKISTRVQSEGVIDTILSIRHPSGSISGWDDDSGYGLDPEILSIYLDQSGDYIFILQPLSTDAAGSIVLTLEVEDAVELPCDSTETLQFGQKVTQQFYVLNPDAGDRLNLTFSTETSDISSVNVNVIQNGNYLASAFVSAPETELTLDIEFESSDLTQIQVADYFYRLHTIEMTVQCAYSD
jgi:hypothetical protein